MSNNNKTAFQVALVIAIIGAINWGLVGLNPSNDLIMTLLPDNADIRKWIYILVGIAGVVCAYMWANYGGDVCADAANAGQKKQ
jgi:uncharacterized membrane protein YuzA (DUF378 family)